MHTRLDLLALLILGTSLMTGCQSGTAPSSANFTPVNPKAGTVYKTKNVHKDSTGAVEGQDTSTDMVTASGLSYGGKTNVYHISSTGTAPSPVSGGYIHREANGDLSIMGDSVNTWQVIPLGSQSTVTITQDTIVDGNLLHEVVTYSGAGTGSFTVNGNLFGTQKVKQSIAITGLIPGITITQTSILQFAPALGWMVVTDDVASRDPFTGAMSGSTHSEVYSYTLVQ